MKYIRRIGALLLCLSMLTGCTLLSGGDDLLQAPKPSKRFVMLQRELDALGEDMVAVSPQSGQYRNTVTFQDLNGDDQAEAIAVMRKGTGGMISVYTFSLDDDGCRQIGCISGQGTGIGSLSFFSLGDNKKGMIITWTLSNSVEQGMSVCALKNGQMENLLELEYTNYTTCDMDNDAADELLVLNYAENDRKTAKYYDYIDQKMVQAAEADATQEVASVAHIVTGKLASGEQAVFVDNKNEQDNGMQTDIYVMDAKSGLLNLALLSEHPTHRPLSLYYSTDLNGDEIIDVPHPKEVAGYESAAQIDKLWQVDWYNYSVGKQVENKAFTAYLSLSEEWCFIFPELWENHITIRKTGDPDVGLITFSNRFSGNDLLTIHTFASSDREYAANAGGLISLGSTSSRSFAAKIESEDDKRSIGEQTIRKCFSVLRAEWY